MTAPRITQVAIETAINFAPVPRVTQVAVEVACQFLPPVAPRITQVALEAAISFNVAPRITQAAIEVACGFGTGPVIYVPSKPRSPYFKWKEPENYKGRVNRRFSAGRVPTPAVIPTPRGNQAYQQTRFRDFSTPEYSGRRQNRFFFNYGGGSNLPAHVSQVVAEALIRDPAGARASQNVLEALNNTKAPVRASQVVKEALYKQTNPTYVRASQVVIEALIPYLEIPPLFIYPALIGLTPRITKRPKQSVGTGVSASGREIRVNYWAKPQWEWDLEYDILADNGKFNGSTSADIKTLIGFFLAVQGSFLPFYFVDPDDNSVTNQLIGTGDGVTTSFVFQRTYGLNGVLGDFVGTENIGGLNTELAVSIYVNGVLQTSGFTIDTSTPCGNFIQFNTAPAANAVITASFSFWYYCRLKDDSYDFSKFMTNLWEQKKITIFSLKN